MAAYAVADGVLLVAPGNKAGPLVPAEAPYREFDDVTAPKSPEVALLVLPDWRPVVLPRFRKGLAEDDPVVPGVLQSGEWGAIPNRGAFDAVEVSVPLPGLLDDALGGLNVTEGEVDDEDPVACDSEAEMGVLGLLLDEAGGELVPCAWRLIAAAKRTAVPCVTCFACIFF